MFILHISILNIYSSILGYHPILPNTFTLVEDNIPPQVVKWYFDRTLMIMQIFFNEPVILTNSSAIFIVNTLYSNRAQPLIGKVTLTYSEMNSVLILTISDFCASLWSVDCSSSFLSLVKSSYGNMFLSFSSISFTDFNGNEIGDVPLVSKILESGPGLSSYHY